jgi:hypothetical protein
MVIKNIVLPNHALLKLTSLAGKQACWIYFTSGGKKLHFADSQVSGSFGTYEVLHMQKASQ